LEVRGWLVVVMMFCCEFEVWRRQVQGWMSCAGKVVFCTSLVTTSCYIIGHPNTSVGLGRGKYMHSDGQASESKNLEASHGIWAAHKASCLLQDSVVNNTHCSPARAGDRVKMMMKRCIFDGSRNGLVIMDRAKVQVSNCR